MDVAQNIQKLEQSIAGYAQKAGVLRETITVIAVSKTKPAEAVAQAYEAGYRAFGENKVQEMLEKMEELPQDIDWNYIGVLQTNKVKYIIDKGIFLIHSLDRESLAGELQRQCVKKDKTVDVLVQLNISKEDTKSGVYLEELDAFMDKVAELSNIRVKGFMTIGPFTEDEVEIRNVFAQAKKEFDRFATQIEGFQYLSMGMTNDYGYAILEGANMLRIGSAIFGNRIYK